MQSIKGAKIILGLGGAGTGDGGLGAAQALGVKLSIEKNDKQKILSTKDLLNVKNIYIDKKIIDFKNVELIIASDVKNLAIGKNGATKKSSDHKKEVLQTKLKQLRRLWLIT